MAECGDSKRKFDEIDKVGIPVSKKAADFSSISGKLAVENEEHCDFVKLREGLLRTNVDELRERTHKVSSPSCC